MWIQAGLALVGIGFLTACGGTTQEAAQGETKKEVVATAPKTTRSIELSPEAVKNQGFQVSPASVRRTTERKVFPASVEEAADRSASISAPIPARVQKIWVDIGTPISSGQTLLTLASSELGTAKASLLEAKAQRLAAQAQQITAQKLVERERYLSGRGISSLQEKQEAEADLASTRADLAGAEANIQAAEARLLAFGLTMGEIQKLLGGGDISPNLSVRSPIGGRVIQRKVRVGQVVQPGEPLFTISNLDQVWIILKVFQTDVGRLQVGDRVRFTLRGFGNQETTGKVLLIGESLDPETRTVDVRVVIPNPDRKLKPGMLLQAEVDLGGGSRSVLTVPDKALYEVNGEQVVFIRDAVTRFSPRTVKLGQRTGDYVEVLSGLSAGDAVVVEGGFVLKSELLK